MLFTDNNQFNLGVVKARLDELYATLDYNKAAALSAGVATFIIGVYRLLAS